MPLLFESGDHLYPHLQTEPDLNVARGSSMHLHFWASEFETEKMGPDFQEGGYSGLSSELGPFKVAPVLFRPLCEHRPDNN